MAFTQEQEAKLAQLLAAFENGKRINELDQATGEIGAMQIEVMDETGETRRMELERAVSEAGNPIAGRWWRHWGLAATLWPTTTPCASVTRKTAPSLRTAALRHWTAQWVSVCGAGHVRGTLPPGARAHAAIGQ
jgi:hypothetical protein